MLFSEQQNICLKQIFCFNKKKTNFLFQKEILCFSTVLKVWLLHIWTLLIFISSQYDSILNCSMQAGSCGVLVIVRTLKQLSLEEAQRKTASHTAATCRKTGLSFTVENQWLDYNSSSSLVIWLIFLASRTQHLDHEFSTNHHHRQDTWTKIPRQGITGFHIKNVQRVLIYYFGHSAAQFQRTKLSLNYAFIAS